MKTIQPIIAAIALLASTLPLQAAKVVSSGVHTTKAEAVRYEKDYEKVMEAALKEFFATGSVSEHAYRSIAILVGSAEARGYRFEPALRVSEKENLAQAAIIQLLEEPTLRFDYPSIYKLNLKRERP